MAVTARRSGAIGAGDRAEVERPRVSAHARWVCRKTTPPTPSGCSCSSRASRRASRLRFGASYVVSGSRSDAHVTRLGFAGWREDVARSLARQVHAPELRARLSEIPFRLQAVLISDDLGQLERPNVDWCRPDRGTEHGRADAGGAIRDVGLYRARTGLRARLASAPSRSSGRGGQSLDDSWDPARRVKGRRLRFPNCHPDGHNTAGTPRCSSNRGAVRHVIHAVACARRGSVSRVLQVFQT